MQPCVTLDQTSGKTKYWEEMRLPLLVWWFTPLLSAQAMLQLCLCLCLCFALPWPKTGSLVLPGICILYIDLPGQLGCGQPRSSPSDMLCFACLGTVGLCPFLGVRGGCLDISLQLPFPSKGSLSLLDECKTYDWSKKLFHKASVLYEN